MFDFWELTKGLFHRGGDDCQISEQEELALDLRILSYDLQKDEAEDGSISGDVPQLCS